MGLSKKDYANLGKAVQKFNREVKKLERINQEVTAPSQIEIENLKQTVITKNGLNEAIKNLREFNAKTVDAVKLESGELITDWELARLTENRDRAVGDVTKQLKTYEQKGESGFSRAEMGSTSYNQLQAQLNNLDDIFSKTISTLRRKLEGHDVDEGLRKARLFKANYMKEMEKYKGFAGYDALLSKLKGIRNPKTFYKYVSKNELAGDLTYQSDQYFTQEAFLNFAKSLGVDISGIEEPANSSEFWGEDLAQFINVIDEDDEIPF